MSGSLSHISNDDHTGQLYSFSAGAPAAPVKLPKDPLALLNIEGLPTPAVVTEKELCLFEDREHVDLRCISFGEDVDLVAGKTLKFGNTGPMEAAYAAPVSTVLLRTGKSGEKLLLFDLSKHTMRVGESGRPGSRLGKQIFHAITQTAFTAFALTGCAGSNLGCHNIPYLFPPGGWKQSPIAFRPDGKYAYIWDAKTGNQTGKVSGMRNVKLAFRLVEEGDLMP